MADDKRGDELTTTNPARPPEAKRPAMTTQSALVMTLLEAIDEPVGGDRGHVWRVQRYAGILAEELGRSSPYAEEIDAVFLTNLSHAAPLHDIGKIGIDRQILSKPGKLTPEEFDAVKEHVRIGRRMLERAAELAGTPEILGMTADVVLYHHERFDGSGYCAGLKGTDIPLAARIVAIADVYDALTSHRVYKSALDPEAARAMIEAESGKHFDPVIVAAFRARCAEFVVVEAPPRIAAVS